jgi:hypothetical protein
MSRGARRAPRSPLGDGFELREPLVEVLADDAVELDFP